MAHKGNDEYREGPHKCKTHGYQHHYVQHVACGHEFCNRAWDVCPRCYGSDAENRLPGHPDYTAPRVRITAQVLNGATGEIREVVANVAAASEQDAVNVLFSKARKDDFYYRFLTESGVIGPQNPNAVALDYQNQTYWALEA